MKRKIDLNSEYMRFDTREAMLKHVIRHRSVSIILFYLFFSLLGIIVIYDTNDRWEVIAILLSICFIIYLFCILYIFYKYKKYTIRFFHKHFAWPNIVICFFMTLSFMIVPFYCTWVLPQYMIYMPILFGVILVHTTYSAIEVKLEIKNNFSKLYFLIGDVPFFDHRKYRDFMNKSRWMGRYLILCQYLLGVIVLKTLVMRSFNYPSWGALGISAGLFGLFLAFSLYLFMGIYPYFFVHPKVEQKFRSPLRSDVWGFFELDPELAEKTFGKDPVKRPIQYDEVFGGTPEVF